MPTFATRPLTTNSTVLVELQQNYMVGKQRQQRQQISELQFEKFPNPQSFLVRKKVTICKEVITCSDFPNGCYVVDQRSGDGSLEELKSSRSVNGKDFPNFEMLDAKIASAVNNIIQNSQFKKKVSLEEQKAQKEDRFLRERQIAFMIYDYFRVTGAHDTVFSSMLIYSLFLFMMIMFKKSTQDWMKFCYLSMSKTPSDDIFESVQIEDTWV